MSPPEPDAPRPGAALWDPRPALAPARARLAALSARRGDAVQGLCGEVRDVVLIASSSRGGSSVFAELLRRCGGMLHLQAEINPFFTLAGADPLSTGTGCDHIPAGWPIDQDRLDHDLSFDVGELDPGPPDLRVWAGDLAWRLQLAWPQAEVDPEEVRGWLRAAWAAAGPGDLEHAVLRTHELVLRAAAQALPSLNPMFYDIPTDPAGLPAPPPDGPPGPAVLEEPPFVAARPWRRAERAALRARPLVIKTPSNAHRLPFLCGLFPRARVRVLHLRRNPAAAINGLVDGWRFRGFHSHRLAGPFGPLRGARPADAAWWKFDLPPGWTAELHRPLEEVCARQWAAAHTAVLDFLDAHPEVERLEVPVEPLLGGPAERGPALARALAWIGAPAALPERAPAPPPVMATAAPRARRWFDRAEALEPALALPWVQDTARRLGYTDRDAWI